jgi:hypothetical protein
VKEEGQSLPPLEEVEAISSASFSVWSSSDDDSERNLEDSEDAATETPEDSPHLERWEEAKCKIKEEENEMLKEQEALLESLATARKEERTQAAGPGHVPSCPQFDRFALKGLAPLRGGNRHWCPRCCATTHRHTPVSHNKHPPVVTRNPSSETMRPKTPQQRILRGPQPMPKG